MVAIATASLIDTTWFLYTMIEIGIDAERGGISVGILLNPKLLFLLCLELLVIAVGIAALLCLIYEEKNDQTNRILRVLIQVLCPTIAVGYFFLPLEESRAQWIFRWVPWVVLPALSFACHATSRHASAAEEEAEEENVPLVEMVNTDTTKKHVDPLQPIEVSVTCGATDVGKGLPQ